MLAEIITIGDEILIGQIVDTNSAWIAQQLNETGIKVFQISSVSDQRQHILQALAEAENRADLVLITGGLGPTKDDITKNTLSEYFGMPLVRSQEVLDNIRLLFANRGRNLLQLNEDQALVPQGCTVLNNEVGTAPGMWIEQRKTIFVSMPGVPYEMKWLMTNHVLPRLATLAERPAIVHRTILTHGLPESLLADTIKDWEDALPPHVKLAYLPSPGLVRLRLSVFGKDRQQTQAELDQQVERLQSLIPDLIFGFGEQTMQEVVAQLLVQRQQTLATAESCTGGNIAHLITSMPGSSAYFQGAVVAYSNDVKQQLLHVEASVLDQHGAVSAPVVEQMAAGARTHLGTHWAVAVSGIAGPDGATEAKPVGTTWIAVAGPSGVHSKHFVFTNNRERNIRWASIAALNMLRLALLRS